jgi:hypothetical protein
MSTVNMIDHPWKGDDRAWFENNPERAHRLRKPFPGEFDAEVKRMPDESRLLSDHPAGRAGKPIENGLLFLHFRVASPRR